MKLVSVSEMIAIEKEADSNGLPYTQMMENAGRGIADVVEILGNENNFEEFIGLVGPGNNGGDTLVALAYLARAGWRARAYCVKRKIDKDVLIDRLLKSGGEVISSAEDDEYVSLMAFLGSADILLDGLLGTGIKLPLKSEISNILLAVHNILDPMEKPPFILAVDCPSGVDCDTGAAADECIAADLTLTMAAVKQGLLRLPAFEMMGELDLVDIGLSENLSAWRSIHRIVPDSEWIAEQLPWRFPDSHKGTFGTALSIAGSVNYTGAAYLSAKAAYRVGAGLVTLGVPSPLHAALAGQLPEVTWIPLPQENGFIARAGAISIIKHLDRVTAMLIGPGFGLEESTQDFVAKILESKLPPLIVDADGLKLLSRIPDWYKKLPAQTVLTPHPGEMSILTGMSRDAIQKDREKIATNYAREWGHVVVLKGAFSVVASPDGRIAVLPFATPALARAGTGDVLAGIILGLRAQGMEAFEAAVAGAWIHGEAGLTALEVVGSSASVLAGDVLDCINDVMSEFQLE
jgi:NAD(P)H-hydrate epimerase